MEKYIRDLKFTTVKKDGGRVRSLNVFIHFIQQISVYKYTYLYKFTKRFGYVDIDLSDVFVRVSYVLLNHVRLVFSVFINQRTPFDQGVIMTRVLIWTIRSLYRSVICVSPRYKFTFVLTVSTFLAFGVLTINCLFLLSEWPTLLSASKPSKGRHLSTVPSASVFTMARFDV